MITNKMLDTVPDVYAGQLAKINRQYIEAIAERIKTLGEYDILDIKKLDQLRRYGADYDVMINELAQLTDKTSDEIKQLMVYAARDSYDDMMTIAQMAGKPLIPYAENIALQRTVIAMAEMTASTFVNLSNTTMVGYNVLGAGGVLQFHGLADTYKTVVDSAIREISMGVGNFPAAMRNTMRSLADSGVRIVDYESGATRRLDSAVRMNILDGVRDVYQGVQDEIGREIGTDGVELSAHGGCAPDHLPYQGRQYTQKEFDKIQDSLERPFGMWNCRHSANRIIMGISRPAHSDKQLEALRENSERTFEYDGKKYTGYEATQVQRKLETSIRQYRDRLSIYDSLGDEDAADAVRLKINQLRLKYGSFSKTAGLPLKSERYNL